MIKRSIGIQNFLTCYIFYFFQLSCSRYFLRLLGGQGGKDVGLAGVEFHHFLGDERILSAGSLEVLPGLHQVGVGQHLPVLGHLLDHSLVVALQ